MSIRRLGKNTFIRLGDRWFGIQHIEWIRFDEKTLFSSKSVTVNLREVRSTYDEGTNEYKFFQTHFGDSDGAPDVLTDKNVVNTTVTPVTHVTRVAPATPAAPSGMPTYSSTVKGRH